MSVVGTDNATLKVDSNGHQHAGRYEKGLPVMLKGLGDLWDDVYA